MNDFAFWMFGVGMFITGCSLTHLYMSARVNAILAAREGEKQK